MDNCPATACVDCILGLEDVQRLKDKIIAAQEQLSEHLVSKEEEEEDVLDDPVQEIDYHADGGDSSGGEDVKYDDSEVLIDEEFDAGPEPGTSGAHTENHLVKKEKRPKLEVTDNEEITEEEIVYEHTPTRKRKTLIYTDDSDPERKAAVKLMHDMGLLVCQVCQSDDAKDFKSFQKHMRQEHGVLNSHISCCERKFYRSCAYSHMRYHENKEAFKCPSCPKTFLSQYPLDVHWNDKHITQDKVLITCDICHKGFAERWAFNAHLKSNHQTKEQRTWQCDHCGSTFTLRSEMMLHKKKKHSDQISCICETCGKGFPNIQRLNEHTALHKERKTQRCEICNKHYFNMYNHMQRVHLDTEMKHCPHCNYQNTSKFNLKRHMIKHQEQKETHPCEMCEKIYMSKKSLREHVINVHQGIKFECCFCPAQWTSSGNLHNHMTKSHPVEYEKRKAEKKEKYLRERMKTTQGTEIDVEPTEDQ